MNVDINFQKKYYSTTVNLRSSYMLQESRTRLFTLQQFLQLPVEGGKGKERVLKRKEEGDKGGTLKTT